MFTRALCSFHPTRTLLLGAAVVALTAMPAAAQKATQAKKSEKLAWAKAPPFLPAGAMMAVVSGDPTKSGPFVVELSMPSGYKIPPHSHPTAEKITVKSGQFLYGMGDEMKASEMKTMKPGNSGEIPANMHHYAKARGKTRIELSSTGPFVINYVHAKDDPRTRAN